MTSLLDFAKICRLCLNQDLPLFGIFRKDDSLELPTSMSSKIMACVSVEVESGDNLPDKICNRCVEQIENWVKFKALCDNTNLFLLQYATGISPISDEVLKNNLQTCDDENLDIPSTPSEFSFVDINFLEHDSLLQKINDTDEDDVLSTKSIINNTFNLKLDENNENIRESPANETVSLSKLDEEIKTAQRHKWREKYAKSYRKKYNCDLCNNVFTKFSKLLEHDRVDHKDLVREQVCLFCNRVFISKDRLEVHQEMKHKEKLYDCDICGLKSVSKKSLEVHKIKHSGRFECTVCRATKSTSRSLQDHLRSHSGDKTFMCDICQRSFKQQQSLEHHLKSHNSHLKPEFKCSTCPKTFNSVSCLNIHRTTHNTQNETICDVCGKTFKNENTLYSHKLNHQEKKHVCMVCDKMFTTKNLLSRHMQTHGPKTFVCTVCDKSYNRADSLSMHMKSHSLPTFCCSICGVCFSLNKYLKQHIIKLHKVQY